MFDDMFENDFTTIPLKNGCKLIYGTLKQQLLPTEEEMDKLWSIRPTQREEYNMYGKTIPVPRYFQFFSKAKLITAFSGQTFASDLLTCEGYPTRIMDQCPGMYNYNSTLINWYMTGNDYVSFHGDKERGLVQSSPIISISLGGSRRFQVKDNETKEMVFNKIINHGDCLIMHGKEFQYTYKHSIPKMVAKKDGIVSPRVNLTIRNYLR